MVEYSLTVEWSLDALADLERFATVLNEAAPALASSVAKELIAKARLIGERPMIGRPIAGDARRQFVLRVLNAPYVL